MGRYGHQQIDQMMGRPINDLIKLAHHVGELLKEEAPKLGPEF